MSPPPLVAARQSDVNHIIWVCCSGAGQVECHCLPSTWSVSTIALLAVPDHGPPGPEAWKPLRAPRTYICNIYHILVLFLLLASLLRNIVYVKNQLFLHNLLQNNAGWNALYVTRGLLHLNINDVYISFTSTFDNFDKPMWHAKKSNYNLKQTMTWLNKH